MPTLKSSAPTHLSIFVTDPDTGQPVARLPLYAEVAVPRIPPPPPMDERFRELIRAALLEIDPTVDDAVRDRAENAALQALGQITDEETRNELITQPPRVVKLFRRVFKETLVTAGREHMVDIPPSDLKPLIVVALRRVAAEMGLDLIPVAEKTGAIWADPLGVLATDHVGYVSFDLKRLRPEVQAMLAEAIDTRRNDPDAVLNVAIWVYPYGYAGKFNALSQARFALDAVVARFSMSWHTLPPGLINMGLRALQNPGLTDWRLSPASFAASPKTLVGEDNCEEMVPANLALQEFVLRQVVRLTDVPPKFGVPPGFKVAYVDDYKVSWYSLGHSLGEILYSLPLAPGETVKLAVVDWSWDSLTKRDETTKLTENVLHQTHRDRTITETVKAGLQELQHGSSFMGGAAGASGGTGGANLGVVGLGAAVGNTWSLGGSTATSEGSRYLTAENVQRLNDSFLQASSAQREINSTVVIQARQEEKESVQTRTFSNYNHSHTLTVLYYEVLRHYRVTVEWVRRRSAVLVNIPEHVTNFDEATLIGSRFLLEPALLDPSLKPAFDLLEKQETIREHQVLNGITPSDKPTLQFWEGDIEFSLFEFGLKTSEGLKDKTDQLVMINLILVDGTTVTRPPVHAWEKGSQTDNVNTGERLDNTTMGWFIAKPDQPVKWRHLMGFEFVLHDTDEWRMDRLAINGFHGGGGISLFDNAEVDYWFETNGSSNTVTYIKRPGPLPPPLPPINSPDKSLTQEERHLVTKLIDHFARSKDYYNRVLLMGTDPTSIAIEMEGRPWAAGQFMADNVDPTPLEVFGSYVAYPLAKQKSEVNDVAGALNGNDLERRQWAMDKLDAMSEEDRQTVLDLTSAKSERLITLPTRGVFAEGKLGHCNISEEIDNTRFWKWEEHPIPIEAPGINPVTPIQPQPQQVSAAPTAFPQSLLNIVNPSPAPDPTGLAAALSLLGTPNIFRDMSGRQEVADLLKKLSDNSIKIAEAANRAREIQAKYGVDLDKQQKGYDLGLAQTNADLEKAKLELVKERTHQVTPSEALDAIKLSEAQLRKGNKTIEGHHQYTEAQQSNIPGATPNPSVPRPLEPKAADKISSAGLTFIIQFHNVASTIPSGTMNATIKGLHSTQTFTNIQLDNGGVQLKADKITTEGRIAIGVAYTINSWEDVVADAIGKAGTGLPVKQLQVSLNTARDYHLPANNSNVIVLNVSPKVETVGVKATSARVAADRAKAEIGVNMEIVSVNVAGETGTNQQTGEEVAYKVYHLTGGLVIKQDD